ncbi:MAG: AAA family ATPase, partial [Phycisphaerae bacterium]|nr:AAA family ATPase [Phycisphaerae bacterium]
MQNNTTLQQPQWLQNFLREGDIKRLILLEGNVNDIFYDPDQRQYTSLPQYIRRTIERNESFSFNFTGLWDQIDGLKFKDNAIRDKFLKALQSAPDQNKSKQLYDVQSPADSQTGSNKLYTEPADLLAAIGNVTQKHRCAFILNHTQHMVTQPNHPDSQERTWILQLKKNILDDGIVLINSDTLRDSAGLIVLITNSLANIPPSIYQADPRVKLISVPCPCRSERRDFFLRHIDDLRCQHPQSGHTSDQVLIADQNQLAEIFADITDQFKMIDLKQLLALSMKTSEPLPPEKLVNLYKLGDQRSPWEELSQEKLRQVDNILKKRVVGQDEAVEHVGTMMIRAYLGLAGLQHSKKRSKPKGTLFFVGPTGVGKTELAKAVAEFIFGDESAFIRFDMSEYNHEHSDQKLIGAPPGYVGFEQGGQLTNAVRNQPFSVILFDEIEKTHDRILDKFLQILEDGRLTDSRGETVFFSESVIIFTSNIGASTMPETNDKELIKQHFLSAVEEHFVRQLNRPELLNRLGDNIVTFNKITDNSFRSSILQKKMAPMHNSLRE